MASGTHVASKGARTSYGWVATLPDLSPRLRLGLTGLPWPDGATTAALMGTLASLLNLGAGAVRAARGRRSTLGRHMPWRDHEPATQVIAAGTALERRLSRQLIAAGPSVRTLRRGATLVKQGAAGGELFLLLEGSLAVEVDGDRVGEVGRGRSWGSWRCWSTTSWWLAWCLRGCVTGPIWWPWPPCWAPTLTRWRPGWTTGGSGRRWR